MVVVVGGPYGGNSWSFKIHATVGAVDAMPPFGCLASSLRPSSFNSVFVSFADEEWGTDGKGRGAAPAGDPVGKSMHMRNLSGPGISSSWELSQVINSGYSPGSLEQQQRQMPEFRIRA